VSRASRRLTVAVVGVGVVGCLVLGGSIARAAVDPPPDSSPSVSVSWSGSDDPTGAASVAQDPLGVSDPPAPTALSSTPTTAVPASGATSDTSETVQQMIGVSVLPGSLTVSPTTESAELSSVVVFGHQTQFYDGALTPITVVDARGSLVGWRASVTLRAVSGVGTAQLAQVEICAKPGEPSMVAGNAGDVVLGAARTCATAGQPLPVFGAVPGGGGGTYRDSARLSVLVPVPDPPAHLTASLAVSVH